ncbi:MAG TPA: PLD nuclease N-terminal domain-containing protein [Micromonosporaceae bacterium]
MARFLLLAFLLALALGAVALISALSAEHGEVRRLPRGAWVATIVLLPVVGPALYLWLGRPGRGSGPLTTPQMPAGPRPLAPDDDPEFLSRLRTTPPPRPNPPRPPDRDFRSGEQSRTTDERPPTDG